MSIVLENRRAGTATLSVEDVRQFLYREARFLDDKEWESWLALYAPDAEFWVPSWDDDDQLVTDPQTQISLIWYGTRAAWRTGSSASGLSGPVRPACRSRGHRTTSAMSRS
jgi:3-phenylpropionate/cinnamic acid dioxygenase small subunit